MKKAILLIVSLSILLGISCAVALGVSASSDSAVSTFDDGYELHANWIWADAEVFPEQWVSMRKTFTLEEVPAEAFARISADTKYWLWINGEMVIFEGQLKLGDSRTTWYYDMEDISDYLTEGENTIAVQIYYSGKSSGTTVDTTVPSFLFDAEIGDTLVCSDTTWRAVLDPAYEDSGIEEQVRLGESSARYNAAKEMIDINGNKWTDKTFDDSDWAYAVNQDEKIKANSISSSTFYTKTDPRRKLVLRSIPQWYVGEVNTYTADGANGTNVYTQEKCGFVPLSLPEEYVLEAEVIVESGKEASIGLCVCVKDADNLYMQQISFIRGSGNTFNGVAYKPHTRLNGSWKSVTNNLTNTDFGKTLYDPSNGIDNRCGTKHTVRIEVDANTIKTYMNGTLLGSVTDTSLVRAGSTVGIRQDANELLKVYSFKVTDASGKEIYNAGIDESDKGDIIPGFYNMHTEGSNALSKLAYNNVSVDASGDKYVTVRNCRMGVSEGTTHYTYTITNETNQQGTPYLKVKSKNGGELIEIISDSNYSRDAIYYQYVTKAGEQSWEALGWMNGYVLTFTAPESVEIIELGFRPSGYNTKETGSVVTDNDVINQIYREAYDTLYICMRDTYMDCPDRERSQWWGDAVSNMQQAAYAMDADAALLYAKTLKQVIGFVKNNGALPSKVAIGLGDSELPMQSLAGVHSFWQYYMYYGDDALLIEAYPYLVEYLELWTVSKNGVIGHRAGNWDWFDWGDHPDQPVIETCWYYIALESVLKIANLEGSGATDEDIEFLTSRTNVISRNFDTLYWDDTKNAYYGSTDNEIADDRANAMAVYAGLADEAHYDGILAVLTGTYNASPYMEKYVLEAMYWMGASDEAVERTLNRYTPIAEDGYPTLPEAWSLKGGTKNHAWTGGPLSMLYMYNAGITPTSPGFETVKIRPQLGTLNSVNAKVERDSGVILVNVTKGSEEYALSVTIPNGSSGGVIYVPRIKGVDTMVKLGETVLYANGTAISENMPLGIAYVDEDEDFIGFSVPSGTYNFTSERNNVSDSDSCKLNLSVIGNGSLTVNGETVISSSEFSVSGGEAISILVTPAEGYRLVSITGSFAENLVSDTAIEKNYTVASDTNLCFVFEKFEVEQALIEITEAGSDIASYAVSVYVNDVLVTLPYMGTAPKNDVVTVAVKASGVKNYVVKIDGEAVSEKDFLLDKDTFVQISVIENENIDKKKINSAEANIASANTTSWDISKAIDGVRISNGKSNGFSSGWKSTNDMSASPYVLTFDLGSVQTINQIALFPRSNSWGGNPMSSCNYPVDFTISVSENGNDYKTVVTVKGEDNPRFKQQCYSFSETDARYVKLTVTKLGIAAHDDGTTNNHYRLQLAEVEIYYNPNVTGSDILYTPYGVIPDAYSDADKYPFAVFMDGEFKGAYTHWANTDDKDTNNGGSEDNQDVLQHAKGLMHGAGFHDTTVYIYLRRDYALDSSEYSVKDGNWENEAYNNLSQIGGTLITDLAGQTLTLGAGQFLNASNKLTNNVAHNTAMKFINGRIDLNSQMLIKYSSASSLTSSKSFDITFENIIFVLDENTKGASLISRGSFSGTATVNANVDFINCTFDYSKVNSANAKLTLFDLNNGELDATVTVVGGRFIANEESFSAITIASLGKNGEVVFTGDENGNYITLYMPKGDSITSKPIPTDSGEKYFIRTGAGDAEYADFYVYTLADKTFAALDSYAPQMSITLESDLVMNIYIPTDLTQKFTLDGINYTNLAELENKITIDDNQYYRISIPLSATEAARNVELTVTVTVGDKSADGTFTFSIPRYAERVIADGNETETTLVKDILSYVRAAYTYFGKTGSDAMAKIDAILGDNYDIDNAPNLDGSAEKPTLGITAVTYNLDAKPAVRFYISDTADTGAYTFSVAGESVIAEEGRDTNGRYLEISLYAYQMAETVEYTVNGETDTCDLKCYYEWSKTQNNEKLVTLVERFAKYCESALAYRNSVIGE